MQRIGVGAFHRGLQKPVAHGAAVDGEVLQVRLAAREARQRDPARERQPARLGLAEQGIGHELPATERGDARRTLTGRRAEQLAAVVVQRDRRLAAAERQTPQGLFDLPRLGGGALHELATGRSEMEEILHVHFGADRPRGRLRRRSGIGALALHAP